MSNGLDPIHDRLSVGPDLGTNSLERLSANAGKLRVHTKQSYFQTKTYVVGTQKSCLNEMLLLSTQNIC